MDIVMAKPKPVYIKPPGPKPKRLGTYQYAHPIEANNWDGTVLVWISADGRFWCVHPISGQWVNEHTLGRLIREAGMDMPGSSEALLKMTCDWPVSGVEIVKVRYDFQFKQWFMDDTPPGVPRKYVQNRLYEIPDGQVLIDLATAFAQRHVLDRAGTVHWNALSALRPLNEALGVIVQDALRPLARAIEPVRVEPPTEPERTTNTDAPSAA